MKLQLHEKELNNNRMIAVIIILQCALRIQNQHNTIWRDFELENYVLLVGNIKPNHLAEEAY